MNIIEFLFGWLIKPKYSVTVLDNIIFLIEFVALWFFVIFLFSFIFNIKDKIEEKKIKKERGNYNDNN